MIKDIVIYPDVILLTPSKSITDFGDPALPTLEKDLRETLAYANGYAISAVQIGVPRRAILIQGRMFWNPVVTDHSKEMSMMQEGCLSIPGVIEYVLRPLWVDLMSQDISGAHFTSRLVGQMSQAACHESEHLEGILMTSEMPLPKREGIRNRMHVFKREAEKSGVSASEYFYGPKPTV